MNWRGVFGGGNSMTWCVTRRETLCDLWRMNISCPPSDWGRGAWENVAVSQLVTLLVETGCRTLKYLSRIGNQFCFVFSPSLGVDLLLRWWCCRMIHLAHHVSRENQPGLEYLISPPEGAGRRNEKTPTISCFHYEDVNETNYWFVLLLIGFLWILLKFLVFFLNFI